MDYISPETTVLYRDDRWYTPLLMSWLHILVVVLLGISLVGLALTVASWGGAWVIGETVTVGLGVSAVFYPLFLGFVLHRLAFSPPVIRLAALDPVANALILHTATLRSWRAGPTQQAFALDGLREVKLRRKEGKVILQLAFEGDRHEFTLVNRAHAEQVARVLVGADVAMA